MMKNDDRYAVSVRRPDGGISVEPGNYQGIPGMGAVNRIPLERGI